jgi:hypothetical protein
MAVSSSPARPSLLHDAGSGSSAALPVVRGFARPISLGWFTKTDACRRCQTPWRRGDVGFELGAVTVTTIVTFGAVVIGVAAGLILTAPRFCGARNHDWSCGGGSGDAGPDLSDQLHVVAGLRSGDATPRPGELAPQ